MSNIDILKSGVEKINIKLDQDQLNKFAKYKDMLILV